MTDNDELLTALTPAFDEAIATGKPVVVEHDGNRYAVISDVTALEGQANGNEVPATWTVRRPDGRTAHIFRMP